MNSYNLHVVGMEKKFILPFMDKLNSMGLNNNFFIFTTCKKEDYELVKDRRDVIIIPPLSDSSKNRFVYVLMKLMMTFFYFSYYFMISKKVFFHGLFDKKVFLFLFFVRFYYSKCYWLIWGGGDIETDELINESNLYKKVKANVKSSIPNYVTYIQEDYLLCKKLYNNRARFVHFLMYESNVVDIVNDRNNLFSKRSLGGKHNIQLGNSADIANNHIEIIDLLYKKKCSIEAIFCILSYGEKPWAKNWKEKVILKGRELFDDKFHPIENFMSLDDYNNFQDTIDIAIMGHDRQQAMGNIITLFSLGKTVYLKEGTSHFKFFHRLGFKFKGLSEFDNKLLSEKDVTVNLGLIRTMFSIELYNEQLKEVFSA